ncbi:BPSS1780 family membrane protein [uncultured Paraglaciecola sp.]|uniref:BPSS1780 family membrane protein n=1 Tax=uncultured Paraglaciecola sp. TaxID=1765024 RepID=UPI0030DD4336|tara:strand:- start:10927 stop:11700 length:774 start_codon:yes stop_codon:yes gene_type:complete
MPSSPYSPSSPDGGAYRLVFPKVCKTRDVVTWLREGKQQFKRAPGPWVTCMLIWFAFSLLMSFIPVVGQVLSGLLNYVFIAGLMLGCYEAQQGGAFTSQYMFAGFKHNVAKLVGLGVVSMVVSGGIMWLALGDMYPAMLSGNLETIPADVDIKGLLLSILIASLLLIPLMMGLWFAPVLIIRHDLSIFAALRLSFVACFINTLPFFWYGLILIPMLLFGMFTLGLGLLIVLPVIMISIYASYVQIFLEPVAVTTPVD